MTEQITEDDPRYLVFVAMVERWEGVGPLEMTSREIAMLGNPIDCNIQGRNLRFRKSRFLKRCYIDEQVLLISRNGQMRMVWSGGASRFAIPAQSRPVWSDATDYLPVGGSDLYSLKKVSIPLFKNGKQRGERLFRVFVPDDMSEMEAMDRLTDWLLSQEVCHS